MERLTKKIKHPIQDEYGIGNYTEYSNNGMVSHNSLVNKLGKLEDLMEKYHCDDINHLEQKLELDLIHQSELFKARNKNMRLENENQDLKKQLENAVILPCKVGDTIYNVRLTRYGWNSKKYWVEESIVKEIGVDKKGWYITANNVRSNLSSFQKTWFLTKQEAEAKLKSLEEKGIR